jgi:hypothetical protein
MKQIVIHAVINRNVTYNPVQSEIKVIVKKNISKLFTISYTQTKARCWQKVVQ